MPREPVAASGEAAVAPGEPVALDPFEAGAGTVSFLQDETHFGGEADAAAPVPLHCPIFCGGSRERGEQPPS